MTTVRLARLARRAGWGVGDQAFSSLTNFAVGIVIARALGPADFGAFSLAFATYLLGLGVSRALSTEPLLVRYSGTSTECWADATSRAGGTAVVVGVAIGLPCALVGFFADGAVSGGFLGLAVTLPGLLLQDSWRFAFFAAGRGRSAFFNDGIWTVVVLPLLVLLASTDATTVLLATLAWGGSATLAAAAGVLQSRVVPRPGAARNWLWEHRDLVPSYVGEFVSLNLGKQGSVYAVGAITGVVGAGAFRAADLLLGPLRVLFHGIALVALPETVRLSRRSSQRWVAACVGLSAALFAVALVYGAVLLLLPDSVGEALLKDSWDPARSLLLPFILTWAGNGGNTGAFLGLRVLQAARNSLWARIVGSALMLALTGVGALVGGASGAAWGLAAATWLGLVQWWATLWVAHRARKAPGTPRRQGSRPSTLGEPADVPNSLS